MARVQLLFGDVARRPALRPPRATFANLLFALGIFFSAFCTVLGSGVFAAAQAEKLGVVLLHGSGVTPAEVAGLADALEKAGYLVERPEMCWALKRFYDKTYTECLAEIDGAIAKLKHRGATSFVVAGNSMGGVAAIAYGATHDGLKGVIAVAPAHMPDYFSKRQETAESIAKAQEMVKSGHADDKAGDDKGGDAHVCKAANACKGKGGCKTGDKGCKGKNTCKGKGGCKSSGTKNP